jgi:hypothetical protein
MGSIPGLRATGQKVWSRFVRGEQPFAGFSSAAPGPEWHALRREVERVASLGQISSQERAVQLARVLDAVSVLAEAHGLSDLELNALRASSPRARAMAGFKRQLKQRASGVVQQVWTGSGAAAAVRKQTDKLSPRSLAGTLVKRQLQRTFAPERHVNKTKKVKRAPFVLRVGRPAARTQRSQLIAASLLHLPRLQRQVMALRRGADVALSTARSGLVRLPASPIGREHVAAAGVLLWSGRSGLQLTYEVASAGAQLFLRSYVLPRVLRYLTTGLRTGVALREVATARVLPPAR